jgi:tetratricopeptide (TPR) repeat protein
VVVPEEKARSMAVAAISESRQARSQKRTLRVFISSPGDVAEERAVLGEVLRRLRSEFAHRGAVEPVDWEHEPLLATASFQEQIPLPSQCDVVVAILWTRLGTRLPARIHRPDGSCYASGTEFEFEDAAAAFRRTAKPDLLVYRKTADPQVSLGDERALLDRLGQKKALDEFFERWFVGKDGVTLEAAFHNFAHAAELEALAEAHLRKLLDRLLPAPAQPADVPQPIQWRGGSPFRGLEAFELEHAAIFFGRRWETVEVLSALRQQAAVGRAFVLILGMTGCGKSSLVRAGVLPMLLHPGVIEGIGLWRRAILRPSDARGDLFAGLAAALLREEALPELAAAGSQAGELAQALRHTPRAAVVLLKAGLRQVADRAAADRGLAEPPQARLALVVDQLEELFTLEQATAKDRGAYVAAIDALARSGVIWVIATLRSDFYPRISEFAGLVALKEGAGQYDLLPAIPAEIGQMIRRPTAAAGLRFEADLVTEERLDDVLRDEAARNPASLPLLEFTLEELYKERSREGVLTFAAYRRLGGVYGALARRAEQVFEGLPEHVQAALPVVFRALVTLAPAGEYTASKSPQQGALSSSPEVAALVDAFVRARLFVAKLADDGSAAVELAHEALLAHWPRLSRWLEEDREGMRVRARLAEQAALWNQNGRSADYLLAAGKPLSEAAELLAGRGAELGDAERQLVEASLARERRRRRRRHGVMASLLALGSLVLAFGIVMAAQSRRLARERDKAQGVSEFLVDLFKVSDPSEGKGKTVTARELLDSGADRMMRGQLGEEPEVRAALLDTMGRVYRELGLFDKAEPLLRDGLTIRRQALGEHPDVAKSLSHLANVLYDKGDYAGAEALDREALTMQRKLLGNEHPDVARSLNNLATELLEEGDYTRAEALYREALAMKRKLLGNEHPLVARSLTNLANVLRKKGDYAGAEALQREALAMNRKLLGNEHPAVAATLDNLAVVLFEKGDYAGAEALQREALAMNRKFLGNEHPQVAGSLTNLADVLREKGDYAGAEALYRDALAMQRKLLGDEHPDVAAALTGLGTLLVKRGEARPAEALLLKALRIREKALPKGHPDIAETRSALGGCLAALGRYHEAEPLLLEGYGVLKSNRSEHSSTVRAAAERLVHLYEAWGKPETATKYRGH